MARKKGDHLDRDVEDGKQERDVVRKEAHARRDVHRALERVQHSHLGEGHRSLLSVSPIPRAAPSDLVRNHPQTTSPISDRSCSR
jgi:hypothetical protein